MDDVRGSFCLTDTSYLSSTEPLHKMELVSKLFFSTLESLVSQHQFLFKELWKEAIPANERFEDIEMLGLPKQVEKMPETSSFN